MPIVNTYGPQRVATAALPGVRKTAAKTALSEGAGVEEARGNIAEATANVGGRVANIAIGEYARMAEQERRRADNVAVLEAQTQLTKWENERLYSQTGALSVKGKAALGLPESVLQEFDQLAGGIEAQLGTDEQRLAFKQIRANREVNLDATLRRHVYGEMQHYEASELQAGVENHQSAAIANALDPRRVGEELGAAVDAITVHGPNLGMGPEQIQKQIEDVRSRTHVAVIDRLLTGDQTKAARIYYEEAKGQISGEALAKVEKAIEVGGQRAEAQQQTDAILAAGGTLTEQREKARQIEDPEVRDQVQQRLEHERQVKDREERETREASLTTAYTILDKTPDITRIPASDWATYTGAERASLRTYSEHIARGVPVETDLEAYYALMNKAGTDPDSFTTENLLRYKGKLGEAEFKQLAHLQLSLRQGNAKKVDDDLSAFRTNHEALNDSLGEYGIDVKAKPGTDQANAIAQVRRMLDRRVEDYARANGGKKPNAVDTQLMIDQILSTSDKVEGSFWNLFPKGFGLIGRGGAVFGSGRRLTDYTIRDVPTQDRTQIERGLRINGIPVTDSTVLTEYLEKLASRPR